MHSWIRDLRIWWLRSKVMADFSKMDASVAKLKTDTEAYIAAVAAAKAGVQPSIDSAQAAVDAVDAEVLAATPLV